MNELNTIFIPIPEGFSFKGQLYHGLYLSQTEEHGVLITTTESGDLLAIIKDARGLAKVIDDILHGILIAIN